MSLVKIIEPLDFVSESTRTMNIAIMTGGGDVPGLNSCIKQLVNRIIDEGNQPLGIRRGWGGLLHISPDNPKTKKDYLIELKEGYVRTIDRTGGTILHTSRIHPGRVRGSSIPDFLRPSVPIDNNQFYNFTDHILKVLTYLKIDVLIVIGGDDTLAYGARIHEEGFPVIFIPKTMDNDVIGTEYCIGFSTAVTRSVEALHRLRTTTGSHERIGILELFGRNSGATSLVSAYLAGADRAIISEVPFDVKKLSNLLKQDKRNNPSSYAMMTISEGARQIGGEIVENEKIVKDPYGHKKLGGIGKITAKNIEKITGLKTVLVQLSFLMRGGPPDTLDQMVAMNFANVALDLINEKQFGRMVSIQEGRYTHVSASSPLVGSRKIDVDNLYDIDNYRPIVKVTINMPIFLR